MECTVSKHLLNSSESKRWKVRNLLFAEGYTINGNQKSPVILRTDLKTGRICEATEAEVSIYCIPGNEVFGVRNSTGYENFERLSIDLE